MNAVPRRTVFNSWSDPELTLAGWDTSHAEHQEETRLHFRTFALCPSSSTRAVGDCCVCLEPTTAVTPCAHLLCSDCQSKLQRKTCPLCRRSLSSPEDACLLTSSSQESSPNLAERPSLHRVIRHGTSLNNLIEATLPTITSAPRSHHDSCSEPPYRLMLRCELARFKNLSEAIDCAEDAAPHFRKQARGGRSRAHGIQSSIKPREAISTAIGNLVENASLRDLVLVAPRLAGLLCQEALVAELILPAFRSAVRQAAGRGPLVCASAVQDVSQLFSCLNNLRQYDVFLPFVEGAAPKAGKQVLQAVSLTLFVTPAQDLIDCAIALDSWPAAHAVAIDALRSFVVRRSLIAATKLASCKESESSPKYRNVSLAAMIDTLKAASICQFLARSEAVEVCDNLTPCFVRENVKTLTTQSWDAQESGPVVARQLAANLVENPLFITYNSDGRVLGFDLPAPLNLNRCVAQPANRSNGHSESSNGLRGHASSTDDQFPPGSERVIRSSGVVARRQTRSMPISRPGIRDHGAVPTL